MRFSMCGCIILTGDNHITHVVMVIMADIIAWKKFVIGRPSSPIFASVIPSTAENTTRPRIFVPSTDSDRINHFDKSRSENLTFLYIEIYILVNYFILYYFRHNVFLS